MKLFPLVCLLSPVFVGRVLCQTEPEKPVHPLVVLNGTGDGSYPVHHVQTITATPTLNGSNFLMWITIEGPRKITNATSTTATVRMEGVPTKVAAIYGDAKVWYPDVPEPASYVQTDPIVGVFFPKAATTANDKRLKLKLKAKIETGELGAGREDRLFEYLAFTLSWFPTVTTPWKPEAVQFYTEETGGRLLKRNQHLSLSGHEMPYEADSTNPAIRTLTVWYKPTWALADLIQPPPATVPLKAPKMNVSTTLDRVIGDPREGDSYTVIKEINSILNPVVIQQVRFSGDQVNSPYYHQLKSDDETIIYAGPQWKDTDENGSPTGTGETNYPFGFTSKSKPKIGGEFKIENLKNQNLEIKASSPQGVTLPITSLSEIGGGRYRLTPTMADNGFAPATGSDPMADYYDAKDSSAFQLDWFIRLPGLSDWHKVGSTKHTVCITKGDRVASLDSQQETLFTLACKNAKGKTTDTDIIAGIWSDFTDREVNRVDGGLTLAYYRDYTGTVTSTRELIKTRDGQCGAWCSLFVDMLKVHGIDNVKEGRTIRCPSGEGFLVKNWDFSVTPSGTLPHPYEIEGLQISSGGYSWTSSDLTDLTGAPGQGRNNPKSFFYNHFIVQIGSNYYDPSYGKMHTTVDAMDGEMDGFYRETGLQFLARKNLTTGPPFNTASVLDVEY